MKPLVTISLVTYNSEKLIRECLDHIIEQRYPKLQAIIIDNNSTDDTLKVISQDPYIGRFTLVQNPKNIGYSRAHNQGIRMAKGEYVICLNPDVFLHRDFVAAQVEVMRKNPRIAAISGKLYSDLNDKTLDSTGISLKFSRKAVDRGQGEIDTNQYPAGRVFGASGAAPMYRKEALEHAKVGGEYFDELFWMYKEDVDLSWRFNKLGWICWYNPRAIAVHLRTVSTLKGRRRRTRRVRYYSYKNHLLTIAKNESPKGLLWHGPAILFLEIQKLLYALLFEQILIKAFLVFWIQLPQVLVKREVIRRKKIKGT